MPAKPTSEQRLDAWLALTGQVPAPRQPVSLPLLTGSMVPAIPVGASLRIAVAPDGPCCPGDVVVFLEGDTLVAHRVLLVLRCGGWNWVLEKGDANPRARWRRGTEICGQVVGFTADDQDTVHNPADTVRASCELRRTLIRGLKFWSRSQAATREPNAHE